MPPSEPVIALDQLPLETSTAPRCALAFAQVGRWQREGDARGDPYADVEQGGGLEFFVRAMAQLMDDAGLTRGELVMLVGREMEALAGPGAEARIAAMMPACTLLKGETR